MKCPKCGYLGFERVDRCRNCGYDFSLTPAPTLPELPIRTGEPDVSPLEDLALADAALAPSPRMPAEFSLELPLFGSSAAPGTPGASAVPKANAAIPGDEPLIRRASLPRPPLAVRRATPELPRLRAQQPRAQSLDLDLGAPSRTLPVSPAASAGVAEWRPALERPAVERRPEAAAADRRSGSAEQTFADAGLIARFVAVVIDVTILAAIDAAVIYFTMQICGITLADVDILPKGPLLAFLLVQNGGYLVAFTVSGQTLGKMATRIRVVTAGSRSRLDLGHAMLRTLLWCILALPAGLGFLTALFSSDRRGLHDRFAGTRVIRALA